MRGSRSVLRSSCSKPSPNESLEKVSLVIGTYRAICAFCLPDSLFLEERPCSLHPDEGHVTQSWPIRLWHWSGSWGSLTKAILGQRDPILELLSKALFLSMLAGCKIGKPKGLACRIVRLGMGLVLRKTKPRDKVTCVVWHLDAGPMSRSILGVDSGRTAHVHFSEARGTTGSRGSLIYGGGLYPPLKRQPPPLHLAPPS